MVDRETNLRRVVEYVNDQGERVSVRDIAEALGISENYARSLAVEAAEDRELIGGDKVVPIIGYVFDRDEAPAEGDDEHDGTVQVIPTRTGLLEVVEERAPDRIEEARRLSLGDLRSFVRRHLADDTVPVEFAWRFWPTERPRLV